MGGDILMKLILRPKNKVFVLKQSQFFSQVGKLKHFLPEFMRRPKKQHSKKVFSLRLTRSQNFDWEGAQTTYHMQ